MGFVIARFLAWHGIAKHGLPYDGFTSGRCKLVPEHQHPNNAQLHRLALVHISSWVSDFQPLQSLCLLLT